MTALAYAGALGLTAVTTFALAALATISRRPFHTIAPALAVVAVLLTFLMVIAAVIGVLQLTIGHLS